MTITLDLAYEAPTSLAAALELLPKGDPSVAVLAGGTDLVGWLRDGLVEPRRIVDLKRIPGLDTIEVADGYLRVGCLVTFSDLLDSVEVRARAPVLAEMAGMVASVGIRNRATLVGNVCSAVPSCDAGPVLLVLDARLHLAGPAGLRSVPVDAWFVAPRTTAIRPGEVVTHVCVPLPVPSHGAAFARLSRYRGEDLAQASVAVLTGSPSGHRVAFGAVAPTPRRARRIEALLDRRGVHPETVAAAVDLVADEIAPISDLRASATYRRRMCEVMLRRALAAAAGRATGDGPALHTRLM